MAQDRNTPAVDEIAPTELARRRANARRTALILAAIVVVIFVTFFLTGVIGRV